MKKISRILIVLAVVSLAAFTKAKAQEIGISLAIGHRPAAYEAVERNHPPRPSGRHIWVAEEWTWRNGAYVYVPGYWSLPPRAGGYWVKGHWYKRPNAPGYKWIPGHWGY
jgi:hypothetical protein